MTAHMCLVFDPTCWRCDLNLDELPPPHVCDSGDFDRTLCPEPCGAMHSYCDNCGKRADSCAHDDEVTS